LKNYLLSILTIVQFCLKVRSKIYLTQAQAVLQEQLRMKHADLSRRIVQQQEELKKISDQVQFLSSLDR
jgi:hypothetical protein